MRVALVCHAERNVDAGVAGVTQSLADALRGQGVEADAYFLEDIAPRPPFDKGVIRQVLYPFEVTLSRKLRVYDVLDVAAAGLWPRTFWPNGRRQRLVSRSHGLEHLLDAELRQRAARGEVALSWKYPIYNGGLHLWEIAQSMRIADRCLLLNEADRRFAIERLGIDANRARVVDNGLPDALLGLTFTEEAHESSIFRIAQIGSYIDRKGIRYGNAALRAMMARNPRVHVTFLGTGVPPQTVLQDFPESIRDRIAIFESFQRNRLPELLQDHQITLFPSLFEGFGMAVMEAMACGLAPVVTAIPGVAERLSDGVDALIVPPRDVDGLVQAMEFLIGNSAGLARIRRAAWTRAQHYSWARIAAQTLSLYAEPP